MRPHAPRSTIEETPTRVDMSIQRFWYRLLKLPPRLTYKLGLGPLQGRFVLLLTTRGRKTGRRRVTPLQYEAVDGTFVVGAVRGVKADWFRNLVADPRVEVEVGRRHFHGMAEPCVEPGRIADFLELRISRHPLLVRAIMRLDGLPWNPDRSQLEAYVSRMAMVTITPVPDEDRTSPCQQTAPAPLSESR